MATSHTYKVNSSYSVKTVTTLDEFETLRTDWNTLAARDQAFFPFLCFDWFQLWLKHFLKDNKLLILLLYEDNNLQVIAPFLRKDVNFKGIKAKKVEFIGNIYSPIQTVLFKHREIEKKEERLSLLLQYFTKIYMDWDVIDLQAIPEEDDTFVVLCEAVKKTGLKHKDCFCFRNWYSDGITYSSEMYFKYRSRNLRASIKKNFRKAKNEGNLKFKMITSSVDIHEYMKMYFEVYAKSWKKRESIGPGFYMDLTKQLAEKEWLRLGFVFLDNHPVAAGFGIVCDGHAYFEKISYDDNYKHLGVGSIWLAEMLRYVIDIDKVMIIDFLRGDDEYKKQWVAKRRERKGLLIFNDNLKGNYLSLLIQYVLPTFNQNKHLRKIKELVASKVFKIRAS